VALDVVAGEATHMNIAVTLSSYRGESAGIPKLVLNFLAKNTSDSNLGILNVNAEIRVAPSMIEVDVSKTCLVGYGVFEYQGGQLSKGGEQHWTIAVALNPHVLRKLEEVRNRGDLFLKVLFFCTATYMPDNASPLTGLARASVYTPAYSSPYCPFRIPQSDWTKTLNELGYGDHFLIEVPLRGVPARVGMKKALAHLEDAWGHFNEGKDDETLVSCYKAFEFLAKQAQVKSPDQHAFEKLLNTLEYVEKRKRVAQLMDYVCRFLALARHEAGQERVTADRSDSEYALILAQASLAYLAKSTVA
jgi:HEPN domain-containing protein